MNYQAYWKEINQTREQLHRLLQSYWSDYSGVGTWPFWLIFTFLIVPLVLLFSPSTGNGSSKSFFFWLHYSHIMDLYLHRFRKRHVFVTTLFFNAVFAVCLKHYRLGVARRFFVALSILYEPQQKFLFIYTRGAS
ncbi:hypothetical protein P4518_12870 [Geobacillus thermodenitrificans]|uniref:hypothetical protein n=1 Tax=Geobacillus thermodenitrificans TaxID=33940 RepID=UPI002E1D753D|nr:hypothetical protein [Geobacillus thermodenitrificans]